MRRLDRAHHLARPGQHARDSQSPGALLVGTCRAQPDPKSQALTAPPSSIVVAEILDASIDKFHATLFVNIGLSNGVLLRTVLDSISGQLTDTRTRFLGSRPVQLTRVPIHGSPAILALSSRSWLNYTHQNILQFTPLIFDTLDHAWSFSAELCPEGLIGIVGNSLRFVFHPVLIPACILTAASARIFTFPKLGSKVQQTSIPLSYTRSEERRVG